MIFEPAELTPLSALHRAELYAEAGVPRGAFHVVQGAAETGTALLAPHPHARRLHEAMKSIPAQRTLSSLGVAARAEADRDRPARYACDLKPARATARGFAESGRMHCHSSTALAPGTRRSGRPAAAAREAVMRNERRVIIP